MKKKLFVGVLSVVTALILCLGLTACGGIFNSNPTGKAYVAVDINPAIELIVEDGKVTSVRALNYDARVMLYGSEGIVGQSPETASRKIAELALKYGYVTEANSNLGLSVSGNDEKTKTEIFESVSSALTDEIGKSGIAVTVGKNTGNAFGRDLKKLKDENPDNVKIQALSVSDYRIIRSAMDIDNTLTIDAALEMDFDDLADMIEDAYEKYGEAAGEKYEIALKAAEYDFHEVEQSLIDPAYAAADPERGGEYVALRKAFLTLGRIKDIDGELAEMYAITADDLLFVIEKLGLNEEDAHSFVKTVTDADGNITEDSIEYYFDKLERNFEGTEDEEDEFEDLIDEIDDYIDEIEDKAETLSADLKAKADEAAASIKEYIKTNNMLTFDDVKDNVKRIKKQIKELEKEFKKDFTDEQAQIVKDYEKSAADQVAQAKAEYEKAVADIEAEISAELEEAQRLRLSIKV